MREILVGSEAETVKLARYTAQFLKAGDCLCLDGDLGAGKTTFTKALSVALGVDEHEVSSPSFTIVQEYRGRDTLIQHFDLYRLDSTAQLDAIGYLEMLSNGAINIIEWSELFPEYLPHDYIGIEIKYINENMRNFRVFGVGAHETTVAEGFENVDFVD